MIYLKLFFVFLKIGLFTFGGGYAMIPLIKENSILNNWITEDIFYKFLSISESTPGPISVNMATFIGYKQAGVFGAIIATIAVVLPSFLVTILLYTQIKKFLKNKYFKEFIKIINPVFHSFILITALFIIYNSFAIVSNSNFYFNVKSFYVLLCIIYYELFYKYILRKKINSIYLFFLSFITGICFNLL